MPTKRGDKSHSSLILLPTWYCIVSLWSIVLAVAILIGKFDNLSQITIPGLGPLTEVLAPLSLPLTIVFLAQYLISAPLYAAAVLALPVAAFYLLLAYGLGTRIRSITTTAMVLAIGDLTLSLMSLNVMGFILHAALLTYLFSHRVSP